MNARLTNEARAACERIGRDPAAVAANIDAHLRTAPTCVEFHVAELPTVTYRFRAAPARPHAAALETIALVRLGGGTLWALGS